MNKLSRPRERAKNSMLSYGLEELKFIRSVRDLKIFYNNIAYLLPRAIGWLGKLENVPPSLQIEPTNFCNVECVCCPSSRNARPKGFMDFNLFERIIADAAGIGVKRIRLWLHGEPMLHPQIINMIRVIKSYHLAFHLTTNGMRWDPERIESVLRSSVTSADHITFSILGSSKKVHEQIMKRVHHERVIQNILDMVEIRRKLKINGPVIETIFYTMPGNEDEEQAYLRDWRGKVDHVRLGGAISLAFSRYKQEGSLLPLRIQTCTNLWERMTIFWDGSVTLCDQDVDGDHLLGNLHQQSIMEIWNCKELLAIKRMHQEKRFLSLPFCAQCDM